MSNCRHHNTLLHKNPGDTPFCIISIDEVPTSFQKELKLTLTRTSKGLPQELPLSSPNTHLSLSQENPNQGVKRSLWPPPREPQPRWASTHVGPPPREPHPRWGNTHFGLPQEPPRLYMNKPTSFLVYCTNLCIISRQQWSTNQEKIEKICVFVL
jgi:hypothetical protein